ncbi:hypothetical protein LY78DRAFT_184795 [Colletotrichum sublineola]|nr:hypothetical protein LY78DRAFT_184795 [Colletotrichum sublineola]
MIIPQKEGVQSTLQNTYRHTYIHTSTHTHSHIHTHIRYTQKRKDHRDILLVYFGQRRIVQTTSARLNHRSG